MTNTNSLLVLKNALFPTLTTNANCILIKNGKILSLENWQTVKLELPSSAVVKDVAGASVLAGLGDAHVHFSATGFLQSALDCKGIKTVAELLERIAMLARQKAAGELILGLRLEHLDFPSKRLPSLAELERVAPRNPVYIRHITGHASLANRLALEFLGFPVGQAGVKLDALGLPSGELIAQATQLATQKMYALNAEQLGYEAAFRAAADAAARAGCTVVHALDDLGAVRELVKLEPSLAVRVLPYTQSFDVAAVAALGLPRIGGCHGCALDGDFDMHTAALDDAYEGAEQDFGVLYQDTATLEAFVLEAHKKGLQCAFHAVGERAVEQALRAYEKAQETYFRPDARHRIEHLQLVRDDHFERAQRAGICLGLQPAFNYTWDHHDYVQWIGKRNQRIDPLASFYKQGLTIAGGSDSTVTDMKPLQGIHAVVNHSRVEERLPLEVAIDIFSKNIAYSTHHEKERGELKEGFAADLTVLQENPFEIDPKKLKDIAVHMTVCRGKVVFEA